MRRLSAYAVLLAALVFSPNALGALTPIDRDFGELSIPRVREGPIPPAAKTAEPRVRVLVRLAEPPLAAWQARRLEARGIERRLNVREPAARRYLATMARSQARLIAEVQRAVPSAQIDRQFRVLLNAITVEVPLRAVPSLSELQSVTKVYPSIRYTLRLNRSPGIIGATPFSTATGALGKGIQIGIVDDGVDAANPFFDPAGLSYPEGFPKGDVRFTTPKVIVARSFPAPGTPQRSSLPFDSERSFHGSHVAGIAAGNENTTATVGRDHPETAGLSGVAPAAQIGNYRVFSLPSPIGDVANTPEIVAAFEQAVLDGMDVVNFSGGGAQIDPANDALVEVVANVAAAGVVPVIAAGNDRDDFGTGTVGSPGTAPQAISVAAVSNDHLFAPSLSVEGFGETPYQGAAGTLAPPAWAEGLPLVDVSTIEGADGSPVDRYLCGPPGDPNAPESTLPPNSLQGMVALASRGICTFASKAARAGAAGAEGLILIDNRPGEANIIPIQLELPTLMVSDRDGARLRDHLVAQDGRGEVRARRAFVEFALDRGGVVTSFSSAGPTALAHVLKPDIAAPGGAVLSSTSPLLSGSPFAVLDGTSMATPHIAGAVALLRERHPDWSPAEVKSALMSTATPAWADSARSEEASVLLGGGGLAAVDRADDPKVFTSPSSLSFGDMKVSRGPASHALLLTLFDAGGGAGDWAVEVRAQKATAGAAVATPTTATVPKGGSFTIRLVASAAADATQGENHGFIVLRRGGDERRVPYFFLVAKPGLASAPTTDLLPVQTGSTKKGVSRARVYRYPNAPFGPAPAFGSAPLDEDGGEDVYVFSLDRPAINFGVSIVEQAPRASVNPFVLGSADENDVHGMAGIPVNVNPLTNAYRIPNGAAAAIFPTTGRYYVSVDSGRDIFTGQSGGGRYILRSWVDDLAPPTVEIETLLVAKRRPLVAARILDSGSGVDPLSLSLTYDNVVVGASAYDPVDGLALFPIPKEAPKLERGTNSIRFVAADYQESKNLQTIGIDLLPNTAVVEASIELALGQSVVSWLSPAERRCVATPRAELAVTADGPKRINRVTFFVGKRRIAVDRKSEDNVFSATWRTGREAKGRYTLEAVAVNAAGKTFSARRVVRICE